MPGLGNVIEEYGLNFDYKLFVIYISCMCAFYSFLYVVILNNDK
jgi:hypothetical protein